MGEYSMIDIFVPVLNIVLSEILMFIGINYYGFIFHVINLLIIIFLIIFSKTEIKNKCVLQSLVLVILLRLINISMPQFFSTLLQYSLIYGIMLLSIISVLKSQKISLKILDFKKFYIYLPLGILIGIIAGIIEYKILNPMVLIEKIRISEIILISLVMFIFVGLVEEIIFRGILQTRLENVFGLRFGLIISGIIFGSMHLSYGILNEAIFAGIFGITVGYIFQKTRNIPFIVLIHGTANLALFGILPVMI